MSDWDTVNSMVIEYRLTELFRVPADVAKSIRNRIEDAARARVMCDCLQRRVEYLEQHVAEEIRNPRQTADTTRFTGD